MALECYMFLFPRNRHQAVHTKPFTHQFYVLVKVFLEQLDNDSLGTGTFNSVVPFIKQSYV
jgi:hypothetical protein